MHCRAEKIGPAAEKNSDVSEILQFVRKNRNGVGNFLVGFRGVWENESLGHEFPAREVRRPRTILRIYAGWPVFNLASLQSGQSYGFFDNFVFDRSCALVGGA